MNILAGVTASSQSRIVTLQSYAQFFYATYQLDAYPMGFNKFDSNLIWGNFGVSEITLFLDDFIVNNQQVGVGSQVLFYAEGDEGWQYYNFRNDGYGLGCSSYTDALNSILQLYKLKTRFLPAAGNKIIGRINTAENFTIRMREVAEPSVADIYYDIRCRPGGEVQDSILNDESTQLWYSA